MTTKTLDEVLMNRYTKRDAKFLSGIVGSKDKFNPKNAEVYGVHGDFKKISALKNHDIYYRKSGKYSDFVAVNRETGLADAHISGTEKAHPKYKNKTFKEYIIASRQKKQKDPTKLRISDLYAHLINKHNYIVQSDASHSEGAEKVWNRLSRKANIHGWNRNKPVNIDPKEHDDKYGDRRLSRYLGDKVGRDNDPTAKMILVASKKPILRRKKRKVVSEEGAPTNSVGAGAVAGIGYPPNTKFGEPGKKSQMTPILRRKKPKTISEEEKFAGTNVFSIPSEIFNSLRMSKEKGKHWRKYLGLNNIPLRRYANRHPKKALLAKDHRTGAMIYIRHKNKE